MVSQPLLGSMREMGNATATIGSTAAGRAQVRWSCWPGGVAKLGTWKAFCAKPQQWSNTQAPAALGAKTLDSLLGHHGVVEPVMREAFVAIDPGVLERCVLVTSEGEHGLVHLFGVEHLQPH